jgi:hypothetical protein
MFIVATKPDVVVGLNVTLMLQLAPAPRLEPQLLICLKSAGSPPIAILVMEKTAVPLFVSFHGAGFRGAHFNRTEGNVGWRNDGAPL